MPNSEELNSIAALRILDAAANRAADGLRVVEEYARFALDDAHLTQRLKSLRHRLADALARWSRADLLAARDTAGDVGTRITTEQESRRADLNDVAAAGFQRLGQALRTLEEYGKLLDPAWASQFESLRYEVYTLEKAVGATRRAAVQLAGARLYALVDGRSSPADFARLVEALIAGGVDVIQLRDKRLADRELVDRARQLRAIARGSATLVIVNDRPDLARLSQADGVHVGQEELSVRDARAIVGPAALVGVSTHSLDQARAAVLDGASYIGVGPTFASSTKSFDAFTGLALLSAVAAEIRLPAYAIGGINEKNLPSVVQTGVHGVVVGAALSAAENPQEAAARMKRVLGQGPSSAGESP